MKTCLKHLYVEKCRGNFQDTAGSFQGLNAQRFSCFQKLVILSIYSICPHSFSLFQPSCITYTLSESEVLSNVVTHTRILTTSTHCVPIFTCLMYLSNDDYEVILFWHCKEKRRFCRLGCDLIAHLCVSRPIELSNHQVLLSSFPNLNARNIFPMT